MFIEVLVLSFLLAILRGGRLENLERVKIKYPGLIIIGFGLNIGGLIFIWSFENQASYHMMQIFSQIHLLGYFIFLLGLYSNGALRGFFIIFLGGLLNFLPMAFNGGRMPVALEALGKIGRFDSIEALEQGRVLTHILMDQGTRLRYLGDIIPLAQPYILPKVISIGDIFVSLGIFIFINEYMKTKGREG